MAETKSRDEYFATLDGPELAQACMDRFDRHIERMKRSKRHTRMLRSWRMYYSQSRDGSWDTTEIKTGGVKGELTIIKPNHYRSVLRKIVQMATTEDPDWDPQAVTSDVDAQRATGLARNVLEHYGYEEKLYERFVDWAEACMMLGEAFFAAPWDPDKGAERGVADVPVFDNDGQPVMKAPPADMPPGAASQPQPETTQRLMYEGDFNFALLTPWDCAFEAYSNNRDKPNWAIFRIPYNRFDLAVMYPQRREAILSAPTRCKGWSAVDLSKDGDDEDDDSIFLYYFCHRRTPSVPYGRLATFVDAKDLLGKATELGYRNLPVFRAAPADVLLQDGGYTDAFDAMPLCDAIGAQLSTLLSNNAALGVQRFIADRGANVEVVELAKNLSVIYKNKGHEFGTADFSVSPAEAYAFLATLMKQLELIGNVNAVQRGDVEASKGDSGSKSALLLSASQQAQSGFQKSMRKAFELLGSHIIETLQDRASTERIVAITGKATASNVVKFKGEQLKPVRSVRVKKGSPMLQSLEGRLQLAEIFKDRISDPERIWEMIQSGRFDVLGEPDTAERNLIRAENEALSDPNSTDPVIVSPLDKHLEHIHGHRCITATPAARLDKNLVVKAKDHVLAHVRALMELPPPMLAALGEQSLAPQLGQPEGEGGGNDAQASGGAKPAKKKRTPKGKRGGQPVDGANQPRMPRGPKNPATGQTVPVNNPPPPQV